jgi:rubrerythrin
MNDSPVFGALDPKLVDRVVSRRTALRETGRMAGLIAVASLPVAFGFLAKDAFAQGGLTADIIAALNLALKLEYLESDFYTAALGPGGVDVGPARPIFDQILVHEKAHVLLLQNLLGENAEAQPTFDFTGGGAFPGSTSSASGFFALSQALEDLGVRAYKGQAATLVPQPDVLTTALRIHSVEARHAAAVRRLSQSPAVKGWITGAEGGTSALAPVYLGEDNVTQLGVDVTPLGSATAVSEAFDEPLTTDEVTAFLTPFITGTVAPPDTTTT